MTIDSLIPNLYVVSISSKCDPGICFVALVKSIRLHKKRTNTNKHNGILRANIEIFEINCGKVYLFITAIVEISGLEI
jgi:hypothetical protein